MSPWFRPACVGRMVYALVKGQTSLLVSVMSATREDTAMKVSHFESLSNLWSTKQFLKFSFIFLVADSDGEIIRGVFPLPRSSCI